MGIDSICLKHNLYPSIILLPGRDHRGPGWFILVSAEGWPLQSFSEISVVAHRLNQIFFM